MTEQRGIMDRVAEARERVPAITPEEAEAMRGDDGVVIVDVRDPTEVAESGKVAGAINISRGMLEFRADAATPYHEPALTPDATVILYCASGGRSALAGQALQELGYTDVRNLGGFPAWVEAGLPVDPPS